MILDTGMKTKTYNIRKIRERLNLTQVEFALEVGVDPITVSRWERGAQPSKLAQKRLDEFLRMRKLKI